VGEIFRRLREKLHFWANSTAQEQLRKIDWGDGDEKDIRAGEIVTNYSNTDVDIILTLDGQRIQEANLRKTLRAYKRAYADYLHSTRHLDREEKTALAPVAGQTVDHTLAWLFIRLGPPPEPTEMEHEPVGSSGGGGVRQ